MHMLTALAALALGIISVTPLSAAAACNFTKDLEMGAIGEDVRCLQKYLNDSGYIITTSGGGAPGNETTEFKSLTKAAVVAWQTANGLPATGFFGPQSRDVYARLTGGGAPSTGSANTSALAQLADLQAKLEALKASGSSNTTQGRDVKSLHDRMRTIIELFEEVRDELDTKEERAKKLLDDAERDFFDGLLAYIEGDYEEAREAFDDAEDTAEDALEEAGGSSDKTRAQKLIDEVDEMIDDAEDEIEEADDDGKSTSRAEDYLDKAKDTLDDAEEAYDDGDYKNALKLAQKAEDLVDDALDAIGSSKNDVEDYLDEVKSDLKAAWKEVDKALDKGKKVGHAEKWLDRAEDLIDDAEDAIDDGDENEAEDLLDDAADLIEDALDEF